MAATQSRYLVGRGIADITGEAAECGMLGYGKPAQQTAGIHLRQRARAFVFVDTESGRQFLLVVAELCLMFDSVRSEVLRRLALRYADALVADNVMIVATHTHSVPGGYSHHRLYNLTTGGFRPLTFDAILAGIMDAVERAHADLAPSTVLLGCADLHDASANRSPSAFARDPELDRAALPAGIDPRSVVLSMERGGVPVAAVNWFATHGTSMTNRNRLISSDNKGYAAYHWERVVHGVDYRSTDAPAFVAAFAQSNSGDMSPNLHHRPGSGPTEDEFENTRLIGLRQFEAARAITGSGSAEVDGPIDCRLAYVDLSATTVAGDYTGDGRDHSTSGPSLAASTIAGTAEGPGFLGFRQGRNPIWDTTSSVVYAVSRRMRDSQRPKGLVLPGVPLNRAAVLVPSVVPVQLVRLGSLYLLGIPGEPTIVAGLRLRRTVASVLEIDEADVVVAGYANDYVHYVTTPEEYLEQRYEGGSTLFGRWELPAFQQVAAALAGAMRNGVAVPGPTPMRRLPPAPGAARRVRDRARGLDEAPTGRSFGEVDQDAQPEYRAGDLVTVRFVGAHPERGLRRGESYLEVLRRDGGGAWTVVADDGDWSTTFGWERVGRAGSRITVTWSTDGAAPGRYRIRYLASARTPEGLVAISGDSRDFAILART